MLNKKTNSLLIDGESLLKQGFHGAKNTQGKNGSVGTIFHFINTIKRFYTDHYITKVIVFWEGENSKIYRQGYYPYYKKNRDGKYTDDQLYDLGRQRQRIKQYLEELSIRQVEIDGCEADDGIACYANNASNEKKIIYTNDRDMLQLIDDTTGIYLSNIKTIVNKLNFNNYFDYHYSNSGLIKMIAGDVADNISGLQNIGEGKTLKYFPELKKEKKDINWVIERTHEMIIDKPNDENLKTIIDGKTKWGVYGTDYFSVMEKIISLKTPNVTEDLHNAIIEVLTQPISPEGRGGIKTIMTMMKEDEILNYIPNYDNGFYNFWGAFITIINKEKQFYNKNK